MVIGADDIRRPVAQTWRIMTRLIDVHAPQHDISETLVVHVDAAPADVLDTLDRLGLHRDPFAGVKALAAGRDERLYGLTWHPAPGIAGRVDVVWDLRVEPDEDAGSYLSSTRRFTPSDGTAREALRSHWRNVRASADTIARRTLRTIKRAVEEQPAAVAVAPQVELLLAA
jgi:hypothetical protein